MAKTTSKAAKPDAVLPARIIQLTADAPYAPLVVRCAADRAAFLPEILSLHTKRELSELPGLGRASIAAIEIWLNQHGRRLRMPGESIDSVICQFGARDKTASRTSPTARRQPGSAYIGDDRTANMIRFPKQATRSA